MTRKRDLLFFPDAIKAEVIDLPGSYSLYPKSMDEWVSYKVLLNQDKDLKADVIVAVADASNLKTKSSFLQPDH